MSSNVSCRPIGILLAAGRGRRMNGDKQLFPWPTPDGEKPLVAAAFDAVSHACLQMVVVLGHRSDEVQAALNSRRFQVCQSDPDAPMFASVRAGIDAALELAPASPLLLHPADHPEVGVATLHKLLQLAAEQPDWVIIPEYQGRGGHPALIPAAIARQLLVTDCPQGLGQFWSEHPELCLRVSVDDVSVVRDVDTVADSK